MTKSVLMLLCIAGAVVVTLGPARESVGGLIWHLLPYALIGCICWLYSSPITWFVALFLLLFVDGWVTVEWLLGTKSSFLLLAELLSGTKLFTILPAGLLLGFLLSKVIR